MASTPMAPDPDREHASDQIAGGPPPGVPPGAPPGAPAGAPMGGSVSSPMAGPAGGRPLGPDGQPLGRPPGIPAGGAVTGGPGGGMAGTPPPSMHARPYIARSMSMLHTFRGSVAGLMVLGLIVALMPFATIAVLGR